MMKSEMDTVARSYSSSRVSIEFIQELDVASYSSLAFAIVMQSRSLQLFHPWLGFQLALRTLQFGAAYHLLKNKFDGLTINMRSEAFEKVCLCPHVIAFTV